MSLLHKKKHEITEKKWKFHDTQMIKCLLSVVWNTRNESFSYKEEHEITEKKLKFLDTEMSKCLLSFV